MARKKNRQEIFRKETVKVELRVYNHPKEGDRYTLEIPSGLGQERREEAIKDELLDTLLNALDFSYVTI